MKVSFKNNAGEVLREWELNPSQQRFWTSAKKHVLFSGGFGCGKSLMLILKAIELSLKYPGNYILMGRKTYIELRDSIWKDFCSLCPPEFLDGDPRRGEMKVVFKNKSEIIFRHLDTIAESEIKSMNLGAAFIDQAEDIPREVFLGLKGRLRRERVEDKDRKIFMSCNPKLTWLYADFKQNPGEEHDLIEASTMENEKNLPKAYIEDLMRYPESWKKQYVYGVWDTDLLSDRIVFAREHIEAMSDRMKLMSDRMSDREGLRIYRTFEKGHRYQMGIDCAEGGAEGDEAAITIADLCCLAEAASWAGRIPPDALGEVAAKFARWYQDAGSRCLVVPEMNSIGLALVNKLKHEDDIRIYRREEFDKTTGEKTEKLGWRTTVATKPLMVSHFQELLRLKNPEVYTKETVEQFRSFVWTDEAKRKGMGAEVGFHDDRLISCLLAFFEKGEVQPGKVLRKEKTERFPVKLTPSLEIKNGKASIRSPLFARPLIGIEKRWTVS